MNAVRSMARVKTGLRRSQHRQSKKETDGWRGTQRVGAARTGAKSGRFAIYSSTSIRPRALVALCVRALPKNGQIDRHGVIAATSARPKVAVPVKAGVSDGGEC